MPTKSPTHPSRGMPRSTRGTKVSAQRQGRARNRPAGNARRRANGNLTSRRRTRASETRITLPLPPGSEKVIALVREELEQLMRRWKKLLPRLQQINDSRRRRS